MELSSLWPGIDGNGSGDVLQAGVEVDAYSSGSYNSSFYSAWIEWYPYAETRVSSPAINPGDVVFVEVWNISATQGYAYFYNYSTQTGAEYYLAAPAGTKLKGNSIEWIVESPTVNGTLASGTNYLTLRFRTISPGITRPATRHIIILAHLRAARTLELINQVDNKGVVLSSGVPVNFDFVYFKDTPGRPMAPDRRRLRTPRRLHLLRSPRPVSGRGTPSLM